MKKTLLCYISFMYFFLFIPRVIAAPLTCSTMAYPNSITRDTRGTFSFTIENTSLSTINKIRISTSDSNYKIRSVSSDFTTQNLSNSEVTITGLELGKREIVTIPLTVLSGPVDSASTIWNITAYSPDNEVQTCIGNPLTSIKGDAPPLIVYNAQVATLDATRATITWESNSYAESKVNFGLTSLTSTVNGVKSKTTEHYVVLEGLKPNTKYNYQGVSWNSKYTAVTPILTFTTAKVISAPKTQQPKSTPTPAKKPPPTPIPVPESIIEPPTIDIISNIAVPLPPSITIEAVAKTPDMLKEAFISLDNGKNWLTATQINLESPGVFRIKFLLSDLKDGNYEIKAKAQDSKGQEGISGTKILIIDALPPIIGLNTVLHGSRIIYPDHNGITHLAASTEYTVTLSTLGGVSELTVQGLDQIFTFRAIPGTNFWKGTIKLPHSSSIVNLKVNAKDGAGNKDTQSFLDVEIMQEGRISYGVSEISEACIHVYKKNTLNSFELWDATPYSLKNPVCTDVQGKYNLFVVPGEYYLKISAQGFDDYFTDIFLVNENHVINKNFELHKNKNNFFGPIFQKLGFRKTHPFEVKKNSSINTKNFYQNNVGNNFPQFNFKKNNTIVDLKTFQGKPTMFTFLNPWNPNFDQQLQEIMTIENTGKGYTAVFISMESSAQVQLLQKKYRNNTEYIFPDTTGELARKLNIHTTLTHVFTDQNGVIKEFKTGILSKEEIEKTFENLNI